MKVIPVYSQVVIVSISVLGTLLLFARMRMLPFGGSSAGSLREWLVTRAGNVLGGGAMLWVRATYIPIWQIPRGTWQRVVWLLLVSIGELYLSAMLRMLLLVFAVAPMTRLSEVGLIAVVALTVLALPFVLPLTALSIGVGMGIVNYVLTKNHASDQFTGLNGVVAAGTLRDSLLLLGLVLGQETTLRPKEIMTDTGAYSVVAAGTLRDSLLLLGLVLGQETTLRPKEIMTDTGAYSDVLFALFWFLVYQFRPRMSDVGGARLWRVHPAADYGALNGLARHKMNTTLITEQWDEMLRRAGSRVMGVFHGESLIRTLQRGDPPTKLAHALGEVAHIVKTVYL